MKTLLRAALAVTLAALCLSVPVFADDDGMEAGLYTFSGEDFYTLQDVDGIYICHVPADEDGALCLGDRIIRAGDFLPADTLSKLELKAARDDTYDLEVRYQTIKEHKLGTPAAFTMHVQSSRNEPPVTEDLKLETYKNVPNTGKLRAEDPEGQPLSFAIENQPTRGTVEFRPDGSFLYTPNKNKVGDDSFTYYATDPEGNRSESANVKITILDPVDRSAFSDCSQDAQFLPMWSREQGLFGGETVAETTCFGADRPVNRGEFLVMTMKLAGIDPEVGLKTSGFADQEDAPQWVQPYLVSAMRRGIVSGIGSEEGLLFCPNRAITAAEAALMVERIFGIEIVSETAALDSTESDWNEAAVSTAAANGLPLPESGSFTRLDAVSLLYSVKAAQN